MPVSKTRFINPKTLSKPPGYTHVVEATAPARIVYIAGQLGVGLDGNVVGDFRAQAVQTFENLKAALAAVGGRFEHVVKLNNYLDRHRRPADLPRGARRLSAEGEQAGEHDAVDLEARARGRALGGRGGRHAARRGALEASRREVLAQEAPRARAAVYATKRKVSSAKTGSRMTPDQIM